MNNQINYVSSGNNKVAMIFNEPANAKRLVLILHSFSAGKNGNVEKQIAQELNSRGISSVRFDFTGIEDSKADFSNHTVSKCIEDTLSVYNFGKKKGYEDIAIYGFSMGGNVALNVLSQYQSLFSTFALNAPVTNIPKILESYGSEFMNQWKQNGFFPYMNQINGITYNVDYQFYEDAKKHIILPGQINLELPGLIIHGTADKIVPYQDSVEIFGSMSKNIHFHLLNDATHGLDVVPKNKEFSKEEMIQGNYRLDSMNKFGDFLAK